MTRNNFIINAVKERLAKINEEKDILEDFLRGAESNIEFIIGNPPFGRIISEMDEIIIKINKP